MNSVIEKEKKLTLALTKLKNLNLENPDLQNSVENLNSKKNQLETEKKELEEKCKLLEEDYNSLSIKLQEMENQEKIEQKKHIELSFLNFFILLSEILLYPVKYNKE